MFPNIKIDLIKELLERYNDTNTVINILLDSINLEESNNENIDQNNQKNKIMSLKELCINSVDNLECLFEKYYESNEIAKLTKNHSKESFSFCETDSLASSETSSTSQSNMDSNKSTCYDDEPLLNLKLESSFLKTLIQLFGNDDDEKYIELNSMF